MRTLSSAFLRCLSIDCSLTTFQGLFSKITWESLLPIRSQKRFWLISSGSLQISLSGRTLGGICRVSLKLSWDPWQRRGLSLMRYSQASGSWVDCTSTNFPPCYMAYSSITFFWTLASSRSWSVLVLSPTRRLNSFCKPFVPTPGWGFSTSACLSRGRFRRVTWQVSKNYSMSRNWGRWSTGSFGWWFSSLSLRSLSCIPSLPTLTGRKILPFQFRVPAMSR